MEDPEAEVGEFDAPRFTLRRVITGIVVPFLFTLALAWIIWGQRGKLEPLNDAPLLDLVAIGVLVLVGHFLNACEFWLLYRSRGAKATRDGELVPLPREPTRQLHARAGRDDVPAPVHRAPCTTFPTRTAPRCTGPISSRRWPRPVSPVSSASSEPRS